MEFKFQGIAIEFSAEAISVFEANRQKCWISKEIGGQLFAKISGQRITIAVATITQGKSRRSRFGFFPDRAAERQDVLRYFQQGLHYVGDWHSHPEDYPSPSSVDLREMQDIFRQSRHELSFMILLIVGRTEFPAGLYVGAVTHNGVTPVVTKQLSEK